MMTRLGSLNKVDFAQSPGGVSLHDDKVGVTEQG